MWKILSEAKSPFPSHESRRTNRVVIKTGASAVVNLGQHPQRIPCLIVDCSPEGFRLRGGLRVKRGPVAEVIPGDELNTILCSVVWVGKPEVVHGR